MSEERILKAVEYIEQSIIDLVQDDFSQQEITSAFSKIQEDLDKRVVDEIEDWEDIQKYN